MNWKYLAGFVDGEGCFSIIHRHKKSSNNDVLEPRFSIGNTNKQILDEINEFTGVGRVYLAYTKEGLKRTGYVNNYYTFMTSSMRDMEPVIKNLLPHLKIKKRLAELFLEFISIRKIKTKKSRKGLPRGTRYAPYDKEYKIAEEISRINQNRGVGTTPIDGGEDASP